MSSAEAGGVLVAKVCLVEKGKGSVVNPGATQIIFVSSTKVDLISRFRRASRSVRPSVTCLVLLSITTQNYNSHIRT